MMFDQRMLLTAKCRCQPGRSQDAIPTSVGLGRGYMSLTLCHKTSENIEYWTETLTRMSRRRGNDVIYVHLAQ